MLAYCQNQIKCIFTPNLEAAELSLILVYPFNCLKSYVMVDCMVIEHFNKNHWINVITKLFSMKLRVGLHQKE